jgi:hypothetical protein
MIVPNRRICCNGFNPGLVATTIFYVEVWGAMWLGHQHSLLPETSEQMRFLHARMEVLGLAISCPVFIRVWEMRGIFGRATTQLRGASAVEAKRRSRSVYDPAGHAMLDGALYWEGSVLGAYPPLLRL